MPLPKSKLPRRIAGLEPTKRVYKAGTRMGRGGPVLRADKVVTQAPALMTGRLQGKRQQDALQAAGYSSLSQYKKKQAEGTARYNAEVAFDAKYEKIKQGGRKGMGGGKSITASGMTSATNTRKAFARGAEGFAVDSLLNKRGMLG